MTDIVSKQGSVAASEEELFTFLSDLRNLSTYIPSGKVENWEAKEDTCSFSVPQAGQVKLRITERTPYNTIKVEPDGGGVPFGFKFFIQMKQVAEKDTRIKLTMRAELNVMMKTVIKAPLKKALDQIVDTLSGFTLPTTEE